jgi:pectin methylesterase-like acyl-CoA thioesterase
MNNVGRRAALLSLGLLVVGCSTPTLDTTASDVLETNEAYIVTRIHSPATSGRLLIHRGASGLPQAAIAFTQGTQTRTIRIKSADGLRFSTIFIGEQTAWFDSDKLNFDVKPRTVTYVGDIFVNEESGTVTLRMLDSEETTLAAAKSSYPWVFERATYQKAIAANRPSN